MTAAPLTRDLKGLAAILATSGVIHLVKSEAYEPIMPELIPAKREVILGSGVLEILCAAGLVHPRTRKLAGYATAGLLVGVFPANLKMANDARQTSNTGFRTAAFGRLPLQLPMIRTAWKAARG